MRTFTCTTIAAALMALSGCAQAGPAGTVERAEVENIIQDYLLKNPEVIREALIELDKKEDRASIAAVSDALFKDPRDVSLGPQDAKVTIVEFFDYNCGYCKQSSLWLKEAMEKYPNDVRVVFKELPILDGRTQTSRNAAKVALAAARQGKYKSLHFTLMEQSSLSEENVLRLAEEAGLDMAKLKEDMTDSRMDQHLEDILLLANEIPSLTGTPFFVINDDFIAGANPVKLDALLESALEES